MCIYFVYFFFCFLTIWFTKKETQLKKNKWLLVAIMIWVLIAGLRGYNVGNDTSGYISFFNGRGSKGIGYGTVDFPGDTIEWGFVVIGRFLKLFSDSGTFLLLFSSLFVWFSIYLIYKKNNNPLWCFLIFMTIGNNFVDVNTALRQSYSIGFVLLGIFFLQYIDFNNKTKKIIFNKYFIISLLCLSFSLTIHRTSILLVPLLLFVYFVPLTKLYGYIVVFCSLIVSQLFKSNIGLFFDITLMNIGSLSNDDIALLGDRYANTFGETQASIIRILAWTIPCLCSIYLADKKMIKSFFFKCYVYSCCGYILFSASYMVTRLNLIFLILGLTVFVPQQVNKNKKIYYLYIFFTIYYMWRCYLGFEKWPSTDSTLPYHFIWE